MSFQNSSRNYYPSHMNENIFEAAHTQNKLSRKIELLHLIVADIVVSTVSSFPYIFVYVLIHVKGADTI